MMPEIDDPELLLSNISIREIHPSKIICNLEDNILGRGNFGTVLVGFHDVYGTLAIKCQPLRGSQDEIKASRRKFLKETKMALLASHEYVMRVDGFVQWEGWIGMAMAYIAAGSLHDLLFNEKVANISPILLLRMCYEMSDAITYLHRIFENMRIAHGDLKPQNILLDRDLHCKVADFGGAAFSSHTIINSSPDKPDEGSQYTVLFAAPERFSPDTNRLMTSMDVYSFGVIVYIILVRHYPASAQIIPDLLMIRVIQGVRYNESDIEEIKERSRKNGRDEDVKIITLLQTVMKECWHHEPPNRPAMIQVRDRLQVQLMRTNPVEIAQSVMDVVPHLNIKHTLLDMNNCLPINEILCQSGGSRSISSNVSNVGEVQSSYEGGSKQMENISIVQPPSGTLSDRVQMSNLPSKTSDSHDIDTVENYFTTEEKGNDIIEKHISNIHTMIDSNYLDEVTKQCEQLANILGRTVLAENEVLKTAKDILKMVELLFKTHPDRMPLQLLQLMDNARDFCKNSDRPAVKVSLLERCARVMHTMILYTGSASDILVKTIVVPYVEGVLSIVSSIKNVEKKLKLRAQATCWECIAACHNRTRNIDDSIEFNKKTINALEEGLGEDCRKLSVYASSCNKLGILYETKNKPNEAEVHYLNSHRAYREADDALSEEKKRNDIHKTINDLARLYENFPELDIKRSTDIYRFLKKCNLLGYPLFINKLNTLRFAILLKFEEDKKRLSTEILDMAMNITPPDHHVQEVTKHIAITAKRLFKHGNVECAISLCKCGVELCDREKNEDVRVELIHEMLLVIKVEFATFCTKDMVPFIKSSVVPLGEKMIEKIKLSHKAAEEIKLKFSSLCMIEVSYWCLKVGDFNLSYRLAEKGKRTLPNDLGADQVLRKAFEGHCWYILGYCNHELKRYKAAESDYKKSIELLENENNMKSVYDQSRQRLSAVKALIRSKSLPSRLWSMVK